MKRLLSRVIPMIVVLIFGAIFYSHSATGPGRSIGGISDNGANSSSAYHNKYFQGECERGAKADPRCSTGVSLAGITAAQVCVRGYTSSKGVRNVSEKTKKQVYYEYGIAEHARGAYEIDHMVSLELGGSNDIKNLYPEPQPGARQVDTIENQLHAQVCRGAITLAEAQARILRVKL